MEWHPECRRGEYSLKIFGLSLTNNDFCCVLYSFDFVIVFKFYIFYYFWIVLIGLVVRVFVNGLEDQGSIPGQVIPKTQKVVLGAALLNTQHYKVWIKGKVEQSKEWSRTFPYTSV